MRYIRYALLVALGVVLVTVALANRNLVTLRILPAEMSGFLGWSWSITLPFFLFIFAGIICGLLIGFVWEWMREHKYRAEARRQRREKERLAVEVTRLRTPQSARKDDILALLEDGSAPH